MLPHHQKSSTCLHTSLPSLRGHYREWRIWVAVLFHAALWSIQINLHQASINLMQYCNVCLWAYEGSWCCSCSSTCITMTLVAWRWKSFTSETWSHGEAWSTCHPALPPAVHTSKEQQMHGAHHHRTAAERRAWSGKRVIFNFLLLNCLLFKFFVQRAPSMNLIFSSHLLYYLFH